MQGRFRSHAQGTFANREVNFGEILVSQRIAGNSTCSRSLALFSPRTDINLGDEPVNMRIRRQAARSRYKIRVCVVTDVHDQLTNNDFGSNHEPDEWSYQ